MNDTEVLDHLRDATAEIHLGVPLESIVARGQARQIRRLRIAAAGAAASLAVAAMVVGIADGRRPSVPPGSSTAQLAAFTVSTTPGGSTALTLRKGQQYRLDPDALRQALANHGVPALVTVGKTCDTNPEPDGLDAVVTATRNADGAVYLTINPATMPSGAELSIGYYPAGTTFGLIEADTPVHCASQSPGDHRNELRRPLGPASP
jgi:hypothetical protein